MALGACGLQYPTNQFGTLVSGYIAAKSAEYAYEQTPQVKASVVAEINARGQVLWADLEALQPLVDKGQSIAGTATYMAASQALAALDAYEKTQGVK